MLVYGNLERAALELLASDPSVAGDKFVGRAWFNTGTSLAKYWDGTAIRTLVNTDLSQTLTNKTITLSTASRALVTNGSANIVESAVTSTELGYVGGVTSAIQTQLDAKQARSTLTTKGDLYVATASAVVARQAVGTDGQVLTADSGQTNGVVWASPTSATTQTYEFSNASLSTSVSSNILTISLKTSAGSDPSGGSPVKIGFRNATLTSGTYSTVSVTSANSIVLGTAVSLGSKTAVSGYVYVYALNNSGVVELFASLHPFWDEGTVQSTSVTGTSNAVLYGANGRSNMPIRLIGRIKAAWTSGVGWASASEVVTIPFEIKTLTAHYGQSGVVASSTTQPINYDTVSYDPFNCVTTGSSWKFTAPVNGYYRVTIVGLTSTGTSSVAIYRSGFQDYYLGSQSNSRPESGSTVINLNTAEYIDIRYIISQSTNGSLLVDHVSIERIGPL